MSRFVEVLTDGKEPAKFIDADKIVALQRRRDQSGDWFWLATTDNDMTFRLSEGVVDFLLDDALCEPDQDETKSATDLPR